MYYSGFQIIIMEQEFYNQGLTKAQVGDYQGAVHEFSQALVLQPEFKAAYLERGLARLAIADIAGAIADAQQVIQLDIQQNLKSAPVYELLGLAYKKQGNLQAAIAAYKQAATYYLEQKKDEINCRRCIAIYQQLQQSQPPSPADFLRPALEKLKKQDYLGALIDLNWAIQLDPENAKAMSMRGVVESKLGNYQQAIQDLNQALFLDPEDVEVRISRGVIRAEMGDAQGAIADFSELLQAHPDMIEIYASRALARCRIKDYRQAIEDFSRVISLKPNAAEIYSDRAQARQQFGDLQGAANDYQQAANLWFDRSDMKNYQQALNKIKALQKEIEKEAAKTKAQRERAAESQSSFTPLNPQIPTWELQQRLLDLVGGNMQIAHRLIDIAKQEFPNMAEEWYWQKVIFDIESDRST